ncbi:LAFE_0B10022g1_1 [Lachancea fermentati]|uniref:LAFE_0B10022g1_1 n=1 Tax=Lachancea fermentati TaxID=4955 RepID=A0A1G4M8F8_LACFM|nr:LAFE_0B10022g1_1 [Lachancea fermentati]
MSVVIHNGTHTTIAGFGNRDIPQVVCPSSYVKKPDGSLIFGYNEMMMAEDGDIFTIMDSKGIPYNWDALEAQWRWIYEEQLQCNPKDLPLVVTVAAGLPLSAQSQYLELALKKLQVPVFQMVIEPLAVSLSLGRNTALVIDVGAAKMTVTPIIDGTVMQNAVERSKFAGDFLDFQISEYMKDKVSDTNTSSYDLWRNSRTWIQDFKAYMLQVSPSKIQELDSLNLDMMGMNFSKNFLYKRKKTISLTQRECCTLAEYIFQPQLASPQFPASEGLAEVIGKAVKKAGASTAGGSSSGANAISPEQIHAALLTNIVITGSSSLIAGLEQRIVNELSYQFPQYKLSSFANPMVLDRKLQSWHGGVTMANLPSWDLGEWVSRQDYEAEGVEVLEK